MFPVEPPDRRGQLQTALETLRLGDVRGFRIDSLSDLDREGSRTLSDAWSSLDERVRVGVIQMINDAVEERFDLNFGRVLRLALYDESAVVRQLAIAGLWEDDRIDLLPIFLDLLLSDESIDVQAEAARALGTFTAIAAEGALSPDVVSHLRQQMLLILESGDPPYTLRRRVVESLGSLADDPRVESAIEAAYESGDDGEMASALFAMGKSYSRRWVMAVLGELHNAEPEIRLEAVRAAGLLGDDRATPILSEIAQDDEAEIRLAAVTALGQIGGRPAAAALRRLRDLAGEDEADIYDEAIEEAMVSEDFLPTPG